MTNTTNPVSWEALESTPQYRTLTAHQRNWVKALLSNGGNPVAATEAAYNCKSLKNATCLSYEVRRHPSVRAFLELHDVLSYGAPSKEQQIASVLETIREAPAYSRVRAQRLLAELTGFVGTSTDDQRSETNSGLESKGPISKIGDVVLQDGQKYRVTHIDENGHPTEGDLIETV